MSGRIGGGGITKRTGTGRTRVDRDGDLDMDGPAGGARGGRGGARRGGASVPGRHINLNNAPKGPAADQKRSGSGMGAGKRGGKARGGSSRRNANEHHVQLVGIKVDGWKASKGSAEECIRFMERKTSLKFRKTQKQGEFLILYVPPAVIAQVLNWDGAKFAGVNLKITADAVDGMLDSSMQDATPKNGSTANTKAILDQVLTARYRPEEKFLDLSRLGEEAILRDNGFFSQGSTTMKVFPALMVCAEKKWPTGNIKREMIHSVSVAQNHLKSITPVTSLSITFPDLKNLSLEGNEISDLKALEGWRSRFRNLEQLYLTGNPVMNVDNYRDVMIRRYPKLVLLDNVAVDRPAIDIGDNKPRINIIQNPSTAVDANGRPIFPLPVRGHLQDDPNATATQFLMQFFSAIDSSKDMILERFYTPQSTFSLSVNTSAPRVEALQGERQFWDAYIPKSRNMKRIHDVPQMIDRLAVGPQEIRTLWDSLPATRHNAQIGELWSFDVITTEISKGVMGQVAMVHGEFEELNPNSSAIIKRSFDRSFTLGMSTEGVKVLSDLMTVRSYSGHTAWQVDPNAPVAVPQMAPPIASAPQVIPQAAPQLVAASVPGSAAPIASASLPDIEEQQRRCMQLAETTGLNLKYAEMCLMNSNWDLASAWLSWNDAKQNGTITPDMLQ